jgi:hypothetical protein
MAGVAESTHASERTEGECSGGTEYGNAVSSAIRRSTTKGPYGDLNGFPRLEYNLLHHKKKLFIVSGLLIFEGSLLPIVLFYPLWYATPLRHGISE